MSAVEICPDCDIAGCTHIRNRTGAFAAISQPSVEELAKVLDKFWHCDGFDNNTFDLDGAVKAILAKYYVTVKSNGGEIRQGDASKEGAEREVKDCSRHPSPTFSREELEEVMCKSYNRDMTAREALAASLDALIAIGAVRGDVGGSTNPTRPEGGLEPKIHGTSPTFSRKELVEVIAAANRTVTRNGIQLSIPRSLLCAVAALDALIAIGAVRVK